jgi:hypothetical protein
MPDQIYVVGQVGMILMNRRIEYQSLKVVRIGQINLLEFASIFVDILRKKLLLVLIVDRYFRVE